MAATSLLALNILLALAVADPLVTLNHGGQLRGKQFDYNGVNIELFLGIPYAEPPVGELRFEKPKPAKAWVGVRDAVAAGSVCPQVEVFSDKYSEGVEDCLFLDITVPGGVDLTRKRPVMVWIHGGGYVIGSKDPYLAAPLAKHGDVIVVAINYRLYALGFLSDGPGTGNFGLWDQRAALLWVQENIEKFGGDPDLVTIFGESAGAGSVSAQVMGQHNDGLFKRAIQESGTLYADWSWHLSARKQAEIVETIKNNAKCPSSESVFSCLRKLPMEKVFEVLPPGGMMAFIWHPVPDEDFFPANVAEESYELTKRFDLLVGFNEKEGGVSAFLPTFTNLTQEDIQDGLSRNYIRIALEQLCARVNPLSPNLCVDYLTHLYQLNTIEDDKERGLALADVFGEMGFNADSMRELLMHSAGSKVTYAYEFTEDVKFETSIWPDQPTWSTKGSPHGAELLFVFGGIYNIENDLWTEYHGPELTKEAEMIAALLNNSKVEDKPFCDLMMTLWTNFAKSGNPNQPEPLPAGVPEWPQFNAESNTFIQLNSANTKLITTPNKERLQKLIDVIFEARTLQINAENSGDN